MSCDCAVRYHSRRVEWTRLFMVSLIAFMLGCAWTQARTAHLLAQCVATLDEALDVVEASGEWRPK